jgi:cell division transport system ATP-binding protein
MIKFDRVTKKFPSDVVALEEVTFEIEPGEMVFLTGPSGAGKTTLGRMLLGELEPSEGDLRVGEYDLTSLDQREIPWLRRQIGFAFQDFKLLSDRTAAENIALSLEIVDKGIEEVYEKVKELLGLTGLEGKGDLFPHQLSGGEVQRAVIARALATEPAVLFADEPTGNLDDETATSIIGLLTDINRMGTTVIIATHDHNIINRVKGRHIRLEKGKIVADSGFIKKPETGEKKVEKKLTKVSDKKKEAGKVEKTEGDSKGDKGSGKKTKNKKKKKPEKEIKDE